MHTFNIQKAMFKYNNKKKAYVIGVLKIAQIGFSLPRTSRETANGSLSKKQIRAI